jgi:hypothetical protein
MVDFFKEQVGESVKIGDQEVVLIARSFRLMFPGKRGGLIWNRPVAVKVHRASGDETVLPVDDITRRAVVILLAGGFLVPLFIWLFLRNRH